MPRRIHVATATIGAEIRNGTRQPHDSNAAASSANFSADTIASASKRPRLAVLCSTLVAMPLRPAGACSIT